MIDTSVLVELLEVPGMCSDARRLLAEFGDRINAGDLFDLPLPVLVETGNHIGQHGDPDARRRTAERFKHFVDLALSGKHPYRVLAAPDAAWVRAWIEAFPAHVARSDSKGRGCGLGDLAIVQTVARLRTALEKTDVSVWTMDEHLARLCA